MATRPTREPRRVCPCGLRALRAHHHGLPEIPYERFSSVSRWAWRPSKSCYLGENWAYVWAGFRTVGPSYSTTIGAPMLARERGYLGAGGAPQEPRGVAIGCHEIRPNPNFRARHRHYFVLAFAMGRMATPCHFRYGRRPRAPFRGRNGPRSPKAIE